MFNFFRITKSAFLTFLFLDKFQLWLPILGGYEWGNLWDMGLEVMGDVTWLHTPLLSLTAWVLPFAMFESPQTPWSYFLLVESQNVIFWIKMCCALYNKIVQSIKMFVVVMVEGIGGRWCPRDWKNFPVPSGRTYIRHTVWLPSWILCQEVNWIMATAQP